MKISFGTTWLSRDLSGDSVTQGLTLNGQQVNDEAQFFRALTSTFFARGNRSATVGFTVNRQLGSLRAAERLLATHFWDLPQQADLRLYCGQDDDQEVVLFTAAVIESVQPGPTVGVSLSLRYTFRVSSPTVEVSPPDLPEPEMIKRGTVDIPSGADHVDVTFMAAFAAAPFVVVTVLRPEGGDNIWPMLRGDPTTEGFTADLSAPTPDDTFKLSWFAIA